MAIQTLSARKSSVSLTDAEIRTLIATAQDVPTSTRTEEDGTETTVYGTTPAADRALEALVTAFLPALHKAARRANTLGTSTEDGDAGDAFPVVLEAFMVAVRQYDLDSDIPFHATISVVLQRAVSSADRLNQTVTVTEFMVAAYWRVLHRHNGNVQAAYKECQEFPNKIAPQTFLALHAAISTTESLDVSLAEDSEDEGRSSHEAAAIVASPEDDLIQADLMRWLFSLTTDEQATILRLAYGFSDPATENFRAEAGFRPGEILSDKEISGVIVGANGKRFSGWTVMRRRNAALDLMREALKSSLED